MEQHILPALDEKIQLVDGLEQEKLVDQFVVGFAKKCRYLEYKGRKTFEYCSSGKFDKETMEVIFFKNIHLKESYFSISQNLTQNQYLMSRMPFNMNSAVEDMLKRVAKIVILLWYLVLIEKVEDDFYPDKDSIITNTTNQANFGFSEKVFVNKMAITVNGDDYSWSIKISDFLSSKDDIRKLLKRYLFEETRYCGKVCSINPEELDLIKQHC